MWTEGYVKDIDYNHGYYSEMSPLRIRLAALLKGIATTTPTQLNYLELGFGQGVSINIHAATSPGSFWGTDFNPTHAANAQALAAASGANLIALDASFEELAQRNDLPEFDIIALHGVWTWISDSNRKVITDLARQRLKPGGLFYVSYNVTPAWSPAIPLRDLLTQHAKRMTSGLTIDKIDASLSFAEKIVEAGAYYFSANPAIYERLKKMKQQPRNYLAHEYFNEDWHPMPFAKTAEILDNAKLTFGTSVNFLDHIDAINLSEPAQQILNDLSDPMFRETVRDYFVNQYFRRDIFVKGERRLFKKEETEMLGKQEFVLLVQADECPRKVTGALGEAELQEAIYESIVQALSADSYAPKSIQQIHEMCQTLSWHQIIQAVTVLVGTATIAPVQELKLRELAQATSNALNFEFCRRAEGASEAIALSSPVIGAGVGVNRFEQLFLRAGALNEPDAPAYAWRILKSQGQSILKDGEALEGDGANLSELRAQHEVFTKKRVPILKVLGII